LLAPHFGDVSRFVTEGKKLGAEADDVLDAFAMLWTARRIASLDPHLQRFPLSPELVANGKSAQIVA
jgi:predicted RNase H-like nuclease